MRDTTRDLEQQLRDLDRGLDELSVFVLAVALSPTGFVSDDLRHRTLELTDLFDGTMMAQAIRAVSLAIAIDRWRWPSTNRGRGPA